MTGAQNDYKYRGVIPRLLASLYQEINSRYEHQIKVSISYMELYNETLVDLLDENNKDTMSIQEDQKGYVLVKGLTRRQADNEEDAQQILFEGENNKTIAEHKLNKNSSRAHSIFTIHLEIRSKVESSEKVVMSKINLVDLAGSERTKKTGSEGRTLIEAQFINKSLSFLEQVVVALSDQQRDHIPYRQNKLTYLLKDSIGGNSKTCMIANIWPETSHLEETISTLKFASRMMKVSNEISVDVNLDPKLLLKKYEKDIKELKQELAMHDTLANRGRINYEPYTAEQQHKQQLIAQEFFDGKTDDIPIESLRQVHELFFQFRNIYKAAIRDVANNAYPKA
jgi:kinesin family member 6/9